MRLTVDALNLRIRGFDGNAASVRAFGSWIISLFRDLNYTAVCSTFAKSNPDLGNDGDGCNKTSSARMTRH